MCPACVSGLVWLAAGTGSAGGLTAWAVKVFRGKRGERAEGTKASPDRPPVRQPPRQRSS